MGLPGRRRRRTRELVASGWFDPEWYIRSVDLDWVSAHHAAAHFVASGERGSAHPLLAPQDPAGPTSGRAVVPPVDADLASSPAPVADTWVRTSLGRARWSDLRPAMMRTIGRWRSGQSVLVSKSGADGVALTVVLAVAGSAVENSVELLTDWIGEHPHDDPDGVRLVIVLAGGDLRHLQALTIAVLAADRDWTLLATPRASLPAAVETGLEVASSAWTVVWPGYARPERGWLTALASEAASATDDIAVLQPVVVQRDGTIASAGGTGSADPGAIAVPAYRGMPVEDVARQGGLRAPTALGPVLAVRTDQLRAVGGLDPRFGGGLAEVALVDAVAPGGSRPVAVVPGSRVLGRGQGRYGFVGERAESERILRAEKATWLAAMPTSAAPRSTVQPPPEGIPRLRWAIDTASPGGDNGRRWGDRMFAESLARALEALGQEVAVDTKASRYRDSRRHDDVVLVLRGLDQVDPVPGCLNILWVISHPADVTRQECLGYDAVFAASASWARRRQREWGTPVEPLMQCTDPQVFRPCADHVDGPAALFVGNSRGVLRPVLQQSLEAGLRPAVYGSGWSGLIDDDLVVDTFVGQLDCAALYASAGLVLNDHWEDMRREGFVSNRVFDVLACAGRLVTDDVAGLDEIGLTNLAVVRDLADWSRVLDREQHPFGALPDRLDVAARVAAEHSFAARAAVLLGRVLALRAEPVS